MKEKIFSAKAREDHAKRELQWKAERAAHEREVGIVRAPDFDPSLRLSETVPDNLGQPLAGERGNFTQNPQSSMFIIPHYYVRVARFA